MMRKAQNTVYVKKTVTQGKVSSSRMPARTVIKDSRASPAGTSRAPHPFADVLGSYSGEDWETLREEMRG